MANIQIENLSENRIQFDQTLSEAEMQTVYGGQNVSDAIIELLFRPIIDMPWP